MRALDHTLEVPLDHARPDGATLRVYAHPWITNEYEHSGLRTSGERVLDRLLGLSREL